MQFSAIIAALMLCGATVVTALPAAEAASDAVVARSKPWANMHVLIRQEDGSYTASEEMADNIRGRSNAAELLGRSYSEPLGARASSATVQACNDSACTQCSTVFSGSFSSNTGCLSAANTACLIISNLNNANVEFWNKSGCNGNNSTYKGCGQATAKVNAPGTNSLGVHVGC